MNEAVNLSAHLTDAAMGKRLDQAIADLFPEYSRSRLKEWILAGSVQVDGEVVTRVREKMLGTELIEVNATIAVEVAHKAEPIDLDIVYEDDDILVINKPAGLVVHPGAGNRQGTLLNALLHHAPSLENVPRAGIVHRLDKDTTGLMVVAKNLPAQTSLVAQLQEKSVTREYEAIINGTLAAGGVVHAPIGRHATKRTLMAVVHGGKDAVTHYRVAERFRVHTRLRLRLETGRTHQIRVHMSNLKYPLVGDIGYGGRARPPKAASEELITVLRAFPRQALHATILELEHPKDSEWMQFHAPIPNDMVELIDALRADVKIHGLDEA
ncbi:23S rRNA pseudouridine(1911/1915/1917) synthase RluD [Algibacillus agarilyticus]|uniref:23S rRNA pseudouridine(1911/1915/1917) synthase RluD n=1 Tax=Algibacillus agarilyticus TaxID=2234133 RepID=UPI000DD0EA7A|nr:23S rRNA pseudouridine(1911/1915/1917) synthase RluD [Algibacillus agarilyticus]